MSIVDFRNDPRFAACDHCGTFVPTGRLVHLARTVWQPAEGWFCRTCAGRFL